jgi:quinoprotein glucose dehydrogenase
VPHAALTPDDAWGATEEDRAACRALLEGRRSDGLYTPPSLRGTIMYPGNNGGINWGSIAVEPQRGLVVTNTSRLATLVQLVPRERLEAVRAEGGPYDFASQRGTPYGIRRRTLLSPHRTPCTAPPWGTLVALDLATGTVRWEIPFGTAPQEWGVAPDAAGRLVGWPSAGGPIVTAGGLAFIAASIDRRIRAYDLDNGSELWSAVLPLAGMATPMTYLHDGRQYLVIAAGGHGKWGLATGDHVIAFALPEP